MDWYYAINNEQRGPVPAPHLQVLVREGKIGQSSKVWHEGMPDWVPFSAVSGEVDAEVADLPEGAPRADDLDLCAYSGDVLPRTEMVAYGDQRIGIAHKDAFVRSLEEGRDVLAGERATDMIYVGFWWRVLASTIDFGIKFVPNMIFSIPYYYFYFQMMGGSLNAASGFQPEDEAVLQNLLPMILSGLFMFVGVVGFSMFYETWMVGKYGGTVGKLALGFRIVNEDGSKVPYMKAWGRWWAETLTKFIMIVVAYIGIFAGMFVFFGSMFFQGGSAGPAEPTPSDLVAMMAGIYLVGGVFAILGGFGYWMAGRSPEKKTLHDILCKTRVIRKES